MRQKPVQAVWHDPEAVAANAAGRVTPEQRARTAGPWVCPPIFAWLLFIGWLALMGLVGWQDSTVRFPDSDLPNRISHALPLIGLMALLTVWYFVPLVLVMGVRRWWRRHIRRARLRAMAAGRIRAGLGWIAARDGQRSTVHTPSGEITVPDDAPELPPPGTYLLTWLATRGIAGEPILLGAQPVDAPPEDAEPVDSEPVDSQPEDAERAPAGD